MKNTNSMKLGYLGNTVGLILTAVFLMFSGAAFAVDFSDYRTVDGIAIYFAVLPAEMIRGYPKGHPDAVMHGGVPKGKHVHHVMIALFDGKSFERITDARVMASVGEPGFANRKKELEPFTVADALTYGNYIEFYSFITYTIDIEISRPGSLKIVKTHFEFKHN